MGHEVKTENIQELNSQLPKIPAKYNPARSLPWQKWMLRNTKFWIILSFSIIVLFLVFLNHTVWAFNILRPCQISWSDYIKWCSSTCHVSWQEIAWVWMFCQNFRWKRSKNRSFEKIVIICLVSLNMWRTTVASPELCCQVYSAGEGSNRLGYCVIKHPPPISVFLSLTHIHKRDYICIDNYCWL